MYCPGTLVYEDLRYFYLMQHNETSIAKQEYEDLCLISKRPWPFDLSTV
jgi:hypothetical protein